MVLSRACILRIRDLLSSSGTKDSVEQNTGSVSGLSKTPRCREGTKDIGGDEVETRAPRSRSESSAGLLPFVLGWRNHDLVRFGGILGSIGNSSRSTVRDGQWSIIGFLFFLFAREAKVLLDAVGQWLSLSLAKILEVGEALLLTGDVGPVLVLDEGDGGVVEVDWVADGVLFSNGRGIDVQDNGLVCRGGVFVRHCET